MSDPDFLPALKEAISTREELEVFVQDLDGNLTRGEFGFECAMGLLALAKFDGDTYQAAFFAGLDVHRVQAWKARLDEAGVDYGEWSDAITLWCDCCVADGMLVRGRDKNGGPTWKISDEGVRRVEQMPLKRRQGAK